MSLHNTTSKALTLPDKGVRNLSTRAGIGPRNGGLFASAGLLLRSCLVVLRSGATPGLVFSSPLLIPGRFAATLSTQTTSGRAP